MSPIISSTKLSQAVQKSLNVSANDGGSSSNPPPALNVSNENGVSTANGSGANTPNHLSQQNLIKIMKKIKNSNTSTNKENQVVAPPNIMIG